MRFIPEFLSWVFWSLLKERNSGQEVTPFGLYEDGRGFLREVMRPMYQHVSKEAFRKDQGGNNCDHSQKKNLDDINEYFWRRSGSTACTHYTAVSSEDELRAELGGLTLRQLKVRAWEAGAGDDAVNELDDVADKATVIDLVVSHTQLGIEGMILQLKKALVILSLLVLCAILLPNVPHVILQMI